MRGRALPVLERARDAVAGYLKARLKAHPDDPPPPDGPLILRPDGAGFAERDVSAFNVRLRKASNGVAPTLADLSGRFMRYVENASTQPPSPICEVRLSSNAPGAAAAPGTARAGCNRAAPDGTGPRTNA